MAYRPKDPFTTALILLKPTITTVSGVKKKTFPEVSQGIRLNGSFKSFGGTETIVNNVVAIEDTATVETWFRPDITSGCRIVIAGTNKIYEIISEPENIDLRNQYLQFRVSRVKGGV